jgi:urease accessory protein
MSIAMRSDSALRQVAHMLQLSDSALPVGGFSFSNGLESAIACGVVCDAVSLEEFTFAAMRLVSTTDCVAARVAHKAAEVGDFDTVIATDKALFARKLNSEQRLMSQRMGRKMTELAAGFVEDAILARWAEVVACGATPATCAVTQGVAFAACGVEARSLFVAMLYGVETLICNAALRLMRITHHSTQRIIFELSNRVDELWEESITLGIDDMYGFAPQLDLLVSLHEKGRSRMFMN